VVQEQLCSELRLSLTVLKNSVQGKELEKAKVWTMKSAERGEKRDEVKDGCQAVSDTP